MAWSYAQVPNGGFEQWTNGEPDGWFTNNLSIINLVTVTQSSDAHSGASSLRGEAINNNNVVYYSLVVSGKIGDSGFPISQNYSTLSGYYKLSSVQGDKLIVTVTLLSKGSGIAGWAKEFPAATGYTNFSLPIVYTQAAAADTCLITFTLGDTSGTVHAGSVFYIDDISLSGTATSVKEPTTITSFKLKQNYPNPFNPTTVINYEIPVSENVTMTIYNSLGQHIKTLVDEHRNAGHYQVTWNGRDKNNTAAPSGIYFYRIQAGSFIQSKKMILLK
jgi:hypothetical protein